MENAVIKSEDRDFDTGIVLGYAYGSLPFGREAYRWCAASSIYLAPQAQGKGIGKKLYAALEEILLHAVIVDENDADANKISIGCVVTVTNLETGKTMPAYKIVGSQEADVMARAVSEDSPFGKALKGAKVGDEVSVEAPRGTIRYRVEKIER